MTKDGRTFLAMLLQGSGNGSWRIFDVLDANLCDQLKASIITAVEKAWDFGATAEEPDTTGDEDYQ